MTQEATGIGAASGAGAFVRVAFDAEVGHAQVIGLPGVAYSQDGVYYDNEGTEVTPEADVELVRVKNGRTGTVRLVTLEALALLL
jgi:hypothetical protein